MATKETWEGIIRTNYTELLKNIDTESGLIGELKKRGIFTMIAVKQITGCRNMIDKNDQLLKKLQMKDFESFKKFCDALNNSGQQHIVQNYLSSVQDVSCRHFTTDSASKADTADCRAVSDGVLECFKQYWNELIAYINFDTGLLTEIESRGIVTVIHLKKLRDIEQETKRTEQMLRWLEAGSDKQFVSFCGALEACKQSFIVIEYLTPKIREHKIPESKIPEPKIPEDEIPESDIPQPDPSVIQNDQVKSHDFCRDSEGSAEVNPLPFEVIASDIRFCTCNEEFLNTFQARVLKQVAYRCESTPRGRALIMNNKFFSNLGHRDGSDVDTENLKKLFSILNFETVVHSDKDAKEMWGILEEESKAIHHKQYDMFVLFLMSHGIKGEIYGLDCKSLKTEDIVNLFNGKNCPTLLEKPKLFFIQASQGDVKTVGVVATDAGMTACDSAVPVEHQNATMEEMMRKLRLKDDINISIPLAPKPEFQCDAVADNAVHEMADMAIIYATVEGHVAWRKDTGSLFVQCLINVLTEQAHETELMRMITETFNRLHQLEVNKDMIRYKQIGEKRDSLRKEVYLLPR